VCTNSRVVGSLLLVLLALGAGCRKSLSPEVGRLQAPETWITAADEEATPEAAPAAAASEKLPSLAATSVRYHVYWAGSGKSDAVAGYYWALVEGGPSPSTRVPRPEEYRYTTQSDMTFEFAAQDAGRERILYVYAVDQAGVADPTPARYVFGAAQGNFPPRNWVRAIGTTVTLAADFSPVIHPDQVFYLTHEFVTGEPPQDTVPAFSRLIVKSPGSDAAAGGGVSGSEQGPAWGVSVGALASAGWATDASGRPVQQILTPGVKVITVPLPGKKGTTTRYFMVNFTPDTWWAGPDPSSWPRSSDGENARAVDVTDWSHFTTTPAWPPDGRGYFGPDSFRYLPSVRRPLGDDFQRGTFYEIYKNRIYARSEGDTVHMNSWVVLYNGGYDKDSKYMPRVDAADPALPPGFAADPIRYAVLNDLGLQGSPIGFRSVIPMRLTPAGMQSFPAQSGLYPIYEPASVFRAPRLAAYWPMFRAGKAYALARAEDSDGSLDRRILDAVALADRVDDGGGTAAEREERRKIITFYVDKAPALMRNSPDFRPLEGQNLPAPPGTCELTFSLIGMDLDPLGHEAIERPAPGGPSATSLIRFMFTLYGKNLAGRDTSWTYVGPGGSPYIVQGPRATVTFRPGGATGNPFASGDVKVSIQICDCVECEGLPGVGRCVEGIDDPVTGQVVNPQNVITVHYTRPAGCP
jgi:hypothetical protein